MGLWGAGTVQMYFYYTVRRSPTSLYAEDRYEEHADIPRRLAMAKVLSRCDLVRRHCESRAH